LFMQEVCNAKLESLTNMIKSLLIREGDTAGLNFRRYYEIGKDVFRDLNLTAIRMSKRYLIEIDPHTNSAQLPNDLLLISSVSKIDDCGNVIPLLLNKNLSRDIIDINLDKDCDCECSCKGELCGQLKNYEVVYTSIQAPMPIGPPQTFNCFSRKVIYPNGDYYREWNEPVVIYDGDVHTATQLEERKELICKLETKPCGCVKDCKANRSMLSDCCGPSYLVTECGRRCCPPEFPNETYGMEQMGNVLYFNSRASFTHVLVRGFVNNEEGEIMIPKVAKTALLRGIKFEQLQYEKGTGYTAMAIQRQLSQFNLLYRDERNRLFRLLNRFSLKQFYEDVIPVRRYPQEGNRWSGHSFLPININHRNNGTCSK
jgi:hypothetical protein